MSCLPFCLSWPFLLSACLCILGAPSARIHAFPPFCRSVFVSFRFPPPLPPKSINHPASPMSACPALYSTVQYCCSTLPHVCCCCCCMYFEVLILLYMSLHLFSIHTHAFDCHAWPKWIISQRTRTVQKNIRPKKGPHGHATYPLLPLHCCASHPLTPHPLAVLLSLSTHSHPLFASCNIILPRAG